MYALSEMDSRREVAKEVVYLGIASGGPLRRGKPWQSSTIPRIPLQTTTRTLCGHCHHSRLLLAASQASIRHGGAYVGDSWGDSWPAPCRSCTPKPAATTPPSQDCAHFDRCLTPTSLQTVLLHTSVITCLYCPSRDSKPPLPL